MSDDLGSDDWAVIEQGLIDNLPAKLRELSCPAGEPWTGDDPAGDHGHTSCYFNHLAANEIERLRAALAQHEKIIMCLGVSYGTYPDGLDRDDVELLSVIVGKFR